jgi:hypothetical protein
MMNNNTKTPTETVTTGLFWLVELQYNAFAPSFGPQAELVRGDLTAEDLASEIALMQRSTRLVEGCNCAWSVFASQWEAVAYIARTNAAYAAALAKWRLDVYGPETQTETVGPVNRRTRMNQLNAVYAVMSHDPDGDGLREEVYAIADSRQTAQSIIDQDQADGQLGPDVWIQPFHLNVSLPSLEPAAK